MTRLAVLADVHGNLPALEAVLLDVEQQDVDGIIAAGDYVTSGPFPVEVVRRLRALGASMIRGNAERYLLDYRAREAPEAWHTSYQWAGLRWSYQQLDAETLDFIAQLPEQRAFAWGGAAPIRVVHGSPRSPFERLFPDRNPGALCWFREAGLLPLERDLPHLKWTLERVGESVLVCAHTHIPWMQRDGGRLAVNPGAVSLSFVGDTRAHYALLTWVDGRWCVEHRAVPYDLDRVRRAFRTTGFLGEGGAFARAALLTIETGQNAIGQLYAHIDRLAVAAGLDDWDAVPDPLWERAMTTFDWGAYCG
ncbi:MAG: metallophosphoesterase family protein [Anaerolineae bacterium]